MPIGRIYKIVADNTDKIYIGSTKKSLSVRFNNHKCMYKSNSKNGNNSKYIFEFPNTRIELLEEVEYENKLDLLKKERAYIEANDNCVNSIIPTRTKKEYDDKYLKNYYSQTHHCPCGGHYSIKHKSRHEKESKKHLNYIEKL